MYRRQFLGSVGVSLLGAAELLHSPVRAQQTGGTLVIGATGRFGSRFVAQLPASAGEVTAFVRPTSNRTRLEGQNVTFAVGDVWDADTVAAAIWAARPRTIVISVQSRPGQRPMPYVGAAQHVVDAIKKFRIDVEQIFWIGQSGSSPDGIIPGVRAINYDLFTEELEELGKGEKILIDSGLPFTILRVGAIISDSVRGVHPPTGVGRLVEDQTTFGPITYDDLARLAVECIGNPDCINNFLHTQDDTLGEELERWICRRFASDQIKECE